MQHKILSLPIKQESDVMVASVQTMKIAEKNGMKAVESTMCATAVSELATNIIRYAEYGEIRLYYDDGALYVEAVDQGPGITDVEQAMQEGHSGGTGLGMGLSGVARIMDSMEIETTVGKGTRIRSCKVSSRQRASRRSALSYHSNDIDEAICVQPYPGEHVSGDGVLMLKQAKYHFIALWDVSGHGKEAHELSKGVEVFMRARCEKAPHIVLRDVHEKFRGTRGLVAVLARLNPVTGWLDYAGVGNVSLLHVHEGQMNRLVLQEGVMGYQIRTPIAKRLQLKAGDTLIMHSDGIRTIREAVDLTNLPNARALLDKLMRDFRAEQVDDTSCMVLRYRSKA